MSVESLENSIEISSVNKSDDSEIDDSSTEEDGPNVYSLELNGQKYYITEDGKLCDSQVAEEQGDIKEIGILVGKFTITEDDEVDLDSNAKAVLFKGLKYSEYKSLEKADKRRIPKKLRPKKSSK